MIDPKPWARSEWLPIVERAEQADPFLAAWLRERCETIEAIMDEEARATRGWRILLPGVTARSERRIAEAYAVLDDIRAQAERLAGETERS